ncbi:hypothetical protein B0J17DRAFT_631966 [Rhizoctonia solani]|nr:hypothetical protein B0J17DRAFT_631966 [Rhizoctonia solani]
MSNKDSTRSVESKGKSVEIDKVKRRLAEIGWTENDMKFAWANIRPKLIPLLETNRERRLAAEREVWKAARRARLPELILGIKIHPSFRLQFNVQNLAIPSSSSKSTTTITLSHISYTLACLVVNNLYEIDSTVEEMEVTLEERREEIEALIIELKDGILSHSVDQLRSGLQARAIEITQCKYTFDTIPVTTSSFSLKRPLTYDALLTNEGMIGRYDSLRTEATVFRTPPNLDHIRLYVEAQEVAHALLVDMGKPNDSYLEMGRTNGRILFSQGRRKSQISPLQICRLCKEIPTLEEVATSQPGLLRHLRDVHRVAQPQAGEHYTPGTIAAPEIFGLGDYDSDSEDDGSVCSYCYGYHGSGWSFLGDEDRFGSEYEYD